MQIIINTHTDNNIIRELTKFFFVSVSVSSERRLVAD